jgi:hypothetical protein
MARAVSNSERSIGDRADALTALGNLEDVEDGKNEAITIP